MLFLKSYVNNVIFVQRYKKWYRKYKFTSKRVETQHIRTVPREIISGEQLNWQCGITQQTRIFNL